MSPRPSPITTAETSPNFNAVVVIKKAEPVATLTTDRSIPPVNITIV
jgi:hypothetical protein